MMANRTAVEFSALFYLFPCVLIMGLSEQVEAPSVDTVLVRATGSLNIHDLALVSIYDTTNHSV